MSLALTCEMLVASFPVVMIKVPPGIPRGPLGDSIVVDRLMPTSG